MHIAMLLAGSWAYSIFNFFRRLGVFGLFMMGILDSSFLFLPFGNDLLLIALVSSRQESLIWVLYVIMSALGSVVGVLLVDSLMRKLGEKGLETFVKPKKIERLKAKLEKHAGWAVFISTLIPPPFPFTAVVMTASALQTSRTKILSAVFFGRLLRFTAEALLALYLGHRLIAYLNAEVLDYVIYLLLSIFIVGSIFSVSKWLRSSRGVSPMRPSEATD
ncbi:MAG TPA: VTT domain-containing protein [Pyrinomonadaceae bacterium]|nr:VTT domain-containing protein [Pyrinomonadaceae bacterium]